MSITITREQRDVIYERLLTRLTGINDIYIAAREEDFGAAKRLSGEFADYLLILNDDLGWGDHLEGSVRLTSSPDRLRRALSRLKQLAEAEDRQEAELRAEVQERQERNRVMRETCEQLLAELGNTER